MKTVDRESLQKNISEWTHYVFGVAIVSYIGAVFLELAFPGFISSVINLDIFLWLVILLGVLTLSMRKLFGSN